MRGREDRLELAAVGDAIVNRRLSEFSDERFQDLVSMLREADASVVNLETLLHDYEGYPKSKPSGTYMRSPPWVADELQWAGFDLFSAATNHVDDYSYGGMTATMEELESRNLTYAGLGRNLAEARKPSFVDTPAGRIGLVAACSTFTRGSEAGRQRRDVQGRPGLSPLRYSSRYVVPEDAFDTLEAMRDSFPRPDLGSSGGDAERWPDENLSAFPFPDADDAILFESGDDFGVRRVPSGRDMEEILESVRHASRQADWVIVSLHAHEGRNGEANTKSVAPFIERFARSCVDVGADAFVSHGPHVLRGIELYEGAPIFYSLGNFVVQNQTVERLPAEIYEKYGLDPREATPADLYDERVYDDDGSPKGFLDDDGWWESVLPVCRFDDDVLSELKLYPLDLLRDEPRPRRGRPVIADGDRATEILEELARLSKPYGTEVRIEGGVGVVDS
jgi:poly-gamma-glutamate synthesis protein (capsule biosynthesis protein)